MVQKSVTCFSQKNNKPLSEYHSLDEAQEGASYANTKYNNNLIPYHCPKCNKWHLSPENRHTSSSTCFYCKDSTENSKQLYKSRKEALRRADIILEEKGISLKVYQCPYSSGYHLTKSKY